MNGVHSPIVWALFGLGVLSFSLVYRGAPLLVWNASASAPVGLYAVVSERSLARGDLVLADPPKRIQVLAAGRHYLPLGVKLIKRIAALSDDEICSQNNQISINGMIVAIRLNRDRAGRVMPSWAGCRTLRDGDVFLLMKDVPDSFDGRYFGVIQRDAIIARLVPLWTR